MVHHIPRYLAHHMGESQQEKVVLLVVDGLALDQWIVIRNVLVDQCPHCPHYLYRESAAFAWVPTITSVSRQAIFAGKPPLYFPASIETTDKEAGKWTQFWVSPGLNQQGAAYARRLRDGPIDTVKEALSRPQTCVVGLVIDKVDKIMHGMELGAAGMHNQVRQWVLEGYLATLLDWILENGFRVYLTSDHGNIEVRGCGRPAEGVVADLRGERVRVYPNTVLRSGIKERFPHAIEWPSIGLPEGYCPLLAPERYAFVKEGDRTVGHGGISLEELVVPFVEIERKQ